jgi:hypothetical protein
MNDPFVGCDTRRRGAPESCWPSCSPCSPQSRPGRLPAYDASRSFLGMNGFQHRRLLGSLRLGHVREDIAMEMHCGAVDKMRV